MCQFILPLWVKAKLQQLQLPGKTHDVAGMERSRMLPGLSRTPQTSSSDWDAAVQLPSSEEEVAVSLLAGKRL